MNTIYIILIVLVTVSSKNCFGQSSSKEPTNSLPNDESFRSGSLPNGFTYYLKSLSEPQPTLSFNFYVKAGYHHQDSDQLDIAHAVEHLAFKSGERFPEGIVNDTALYNQLNMSNTDIIANAGYERTRYNFEANPNSPDAVHIALKWFKDIAVGLKLSEEDIDKERGALRQEFIYGKTGNFEKNYAQKLLESKIFPCRFDETDFLENNETFTYETLRRFYQDWYRPDLMAISIVGNIDSLEDLEWKIKKNFSDIPPHKDPRNSIDCYKAYYERPSRFVVQELKMDSLSRGATETAEIQLFFRAQDLYENKDTKESNRQAKVLELLINILNNRFTEMENTYNRTYRVSFRDANKYGSFPPSIGMKVVFQPNAEKLALEKIFTVIHQLREYGVTEKEWESAKEKNIRLMESTNTSTNNYWKNEIEKHIVRDEILFSNKHSYLLNWFERLTKAEFNALIFKFIPQDPDDIAILAPTGHVALTFTEIQLRSWIEKGLKKKVSPYAEPDIPEFLLNPVKDAKLHIKEFVDKGIVESGARELVLSNGVKVILKSFKPSQGIHADKIILHGFSNKGASAFPEEDYYSAINTPAIVTNAGAGAYDKFKIEKFLSTSGVEDVEPYIDYKESGIHGLSNSKDLKHLLQLVYLYFNSPRKSKVAFVDWKRNERENYMNNSYGLTAADFSNAMRDFTQNKHLSQIFGKRHLSGTKAYHAVKNTNLDRGYNIYQDIFGNPRDFKFIITGNFDTDSVIPQVQKYLGNLPDRKRSLLENPVQKISSLLKGPVYQEIPIPDYEIESANYALSFIKEVDNTFDWKERIRLEILAEMLDIESLQLRYEKGFSLYNFGVNKIFHSELSRNEITLKTEGRPEEIQSIRQECHKIVSDFITGNVERKVFEQVVKGVLRSYSKTSLKSHRNMQKRLYGHYRFNEPWTEPETIESFIRSVTFNDIIMTAQRYFKEENRYEFVMGENLSQ